jgi:hypothetical protein
MYNVRNIAANGQVQVFDGGTQAGTLVGPPWKFRRCPYGRGLYTVLLRSDGAAAGMDFSVQIGTTEVVQRSPVSVGGTDGVMPTPAGAQAAPAHQFFAEAGDEVILTLFETGAVATTDVSVWANVEPG